MRIGVVSIIHEPWGGSEELWAAMAKKALEQGHEVYHSTLVTDPTNPKINRLINYGVRQILRKEYISGNSPILFRALKKRYYLVKSLFRNPYASFLKNNIDVILYVGTAYSIGNNFNLVRIARKKGIKLYINCQLNNEGVIHLEKSKKKKIVQAYFYAQAVLFVSKRNLYTAEKQLGISIDNGIVVRNPVNLQSVNIIPFPENSTAQFAMVGNLVTMHKGQDMVLEILKNNSWQGRNWHLNVFGRGKDELNLKKLCNAYQLDQKVSFHGKVDDIRKVWSSNHLLLMPSIMEGMPLAVVEAMLCARPSVVTDVGGHTEWIEEDEQGFIAEAASVQPIEKAMEKAWKNKHKWKEIGIAAHNKAMQLYDEDPGQTLLTYLLKN